MDAPEDPNKPTPGSSENIEALTQRLRREQRPLLMQQEDDLSHSLAPLRVGSVRYLNAVPLTRGLEDQITYATPAELAHMLRRDQLDAALVSVTEVLFQDRYNALNDMAIASLGEVKSVLLIHRAPVEQAREIFCDPASLASVNLLRVLLAEKGLRPEFKVLPNYDFSALPDYALLIGDPALDFLYQTQSKQVWDLGSAWYELTGLPFVYAVWAVRRDINPAPLARVLRSAKQFGLETLDQIIREGTDYDYEFRKDYLSWHIHYHLGPDEHAGLTRFIELLRKHDLGPVYEPRFVH